jgi:hypothetical protein
MISKLPPTLSDEEACEEICLRIDEFIKVP